MTNEYTSSSIAIRSYQPEDLSACKDIFTRVHRAYGNRMQYVENAIRTDMTDIEKNYLAVPNGHWWVAVSTDDNRVVGHVAVLPLKIGSPSYYRELPEEERDHVCELLRMAVAPDAQRAGIGKKLLSTLIDFAREKGYHRIHLGTLANMDKACAFYERNGFIKYWTEKYSFDLKPAENSTKRPSPVAIFTASAVIPDEDLRLMKMSPFQSKFLYVQHYSLKL